ncbi:MAG: hypothetical protein PHP97_03490 [Candidatus Shapirobacteria bacterium]|nr:hypothetical protein [Candidatus Shapirobacteria bacterium]MDD4382866.1 hypothetical protein [Candidatus Shapirobacteria bacterium]
MNEPFIPIQSPKLPIPICAPISKKSPFNQTVIITIVVGFELFLYGLLTQITESLKLSVYTAVGILLIITSLVLVKNQKYGKILFSIITWTITLSILILTLLIIINPFGILFLIALTANFSTETIAQIGFIIGLNIYMHSANKTLSDYIKHNTVQTLNITSKLLYFGLFIICLSMATFLYPLIYPSQGKAKEFKSYLENKYHEKFELSNFKTTSKYENSFVSCDELIATAHPKNNHEITFEVSSFIRNCKGYDKYYDDYIDKSLKYKISKKIKEVFGVTPKYDIDLSFDSRGQTSNKNIQPILTLSIFIESSLTKDNVNLSEEQIREMSNYIVNELGLTEFYFYYIIKSQLSADEFQRLQIEPGIKVNCQEKFSIDYNNYQQINTDVNLKKYYSPKECIYNLGKSQTSINYVDTYPN